MHKSSKLDTKNNGMYVVKETGNAGSYIICDANNKIEIVAHRKNLKKIIKNNMEDKLPCEHENGMIHVACEDNDENRKGKLLLLMMVNRSPKTESIMCMLTQLISNNASKRC
ncbi:hypothetical protein BDAP_000791 [Binucleata daphniae]